MAVWQYADCILLAICARALALACRLAASLAGRLALACWRYPRVRSFVVVNVESPNENEHLTST